MQYVLLFLTMQECLGSTTAPAHHLLQAGPLLEATLTALLCASFPISGSLWSLEGLCVPLCCSPGWCVSKYAGVRVGEKGYCWGKILKV